MVDGGYDGDRADGGRRSEDGDSCDGGDGDD